MEVIRYINGQRIPGTLPVMTVENQRMLQIIQEIETRARQPQKAARVAKRTRCEPEPRI